MVNLKENENHNNHRGFERNELEKDYKDLQEKLIDTENKLAEVKKKSKDEKNEYQKSLDKIKRSRSWRMTSPARKAISFFKRK